MALHSKICYFFRINLFKTIYFNFKAFPFNVAIRFPVIVGYNTILRSIGKIKIPEPICTGKIKIGTLYNKWECNYEPIIWFNQGLITINGPLKIHTGAKVVVLEKGELLFGGKNTIGARSIVVCAKAISIGVNSGCSWDCSIFDTDFHFLYNKETNEPLKRTVPIRICDDVFIGNHCNISKGTRLSKGTVVSSWSKVTGSFLKKGDYLLLAGNPASVISQGYTMTHAWDFEKEKEFELLLEI